MTVSCVCCAVGTVLLSMCAASGSAFPPAHAYDLNVLQWNPHWQCFNKPDYANCSKNVPRLLDSRLMHSDIDFANVIELNISWTPPHPWKAISATCSPDNIDCFDQITLIYNSKKWKAVENESSRANGCIQSNPARNRPYIVQQFDSVLNSARLIVVGAHFSHCASLGSLPEDVKRVIESTSVHETILIADTNRYARNVSEQSSVMCDTTTAWAPTCGVACSSASICNTSSEILQQLIGQRYCRKVLSTELMPSCCNSWVGFQFPFDRVISNFGSNMSTALLDDPAPTWIGSDFHKPVLARLAWDGTRDELALMRESNELILA